MNSKTPQLRFRGFDEAWDDAPLSHYLTTSTLKNKDNTFAKEDVLSVSREFGVVNQMEYQGRSFAGASILGYGVANTEDIIYTKSPLRDQPYGIIKTNIGKAGIVSALYAIYSPQVNINPDFIQVYFDDDERLNNYLRPIVRKGAKNTLNVSDDDALSGNVVFPKLPEQALLVASFKNLDLRITSHNILIEQLNNGKKALIAKFFPTNQSSGTQIRVSGYEASWRVHSLSTIVKEYSNFVETPLNGYTRLGIRSHGKGTFHEFVPKGEELEISTMGVVDADKLIVNITFGWELAVAITDDEDKGKLVSHRFPQYSFNDGFYPLFFKYALINDDFRRHLYLASPGSAGRNRVLKLDKMLEYQLAVPSYDEQVAIATILSKYDKLIELNNQKLEKLRQLKSALLDKMFV